MLIDTRFPAVRVQLLTDAEAAQGVQMLTGKGDHLQPFEWAKRELPAEREQLSRFLNSLSDDGEQESGVG